MEIPKSIVLERGDVSNISKKHNISRPTIYKAFEEKKGTLKVVTAIVKYYSEKKKIIKKVKEIDNE